MGNAITDPNLIRLFGVKVGLARALLAKRQAGVKNVAILVGDGWVGVGNLKTGRTYFNADLTDNDGNPATIEAIEDGLHLPRMAAVHKVPLRHAVSL